jgi:hypothetical protein
MVSDTGLNHRAKKHNSQTLKRVRHKNEKRGIQLGEGIRDSAWE